jgi:hypothetical protein
MRRIAFNQKERDRWNLLHGVALPGTVAARGHYLQPMALRSCHDKKQTLPKYIFPPNHRQTFLFCVAGKTMTSV